MRKFLLTNSVTGKREEFKTKTPGKVLFYSCGPTVYGPLHIGNARALIFSDLFYRWLKFAGYEVNFVRNYTDVDDKIINRAKEDGVTADEIADRYIEYCETDMSSLGLLQPTRTVRVRDTIPEIVKMIEKIIKNGHAYVVDGDGGDSKNREVLFDVSSFKEYGKLSGRVTDELLAGARVDVDVKKKNPMDFALWKPMKPGEPFWESPWGKGRPGWHIECSAMVKKWLGDTIDVHHGGQDLIFPHHENEIAQSEAANGVEFCGHWIHHAFMTMGKEKMSKSLGNIFAIRDFVTSYSSEVLKYIYLSHHFRTSVDFSDDLILKALDELERIYHAKKWAMDASQYKGDSSNEAWNSLDKVVSTTKDKIIDEMYADLNTPGSLGSLFVLIRMINHTEHYVSGKAGVAAPDSGERARIARGFLDLLGQLSNLWNVFSLECDEAFKVLEKVRADITKTKLENEGKSVMGDAEIQALVDERVEARNSKNFSRSDEIRKILDDRGIQIIDSPSGTSWKYK